MVFLLRLGSSLMLWTIAFSIILSGFEIGFFGLIGTIALLALWEYFKMLDHAGVSNFKVSAMISGGIFLAGSFYYFRTWGPASSYEFEVLVVLLLLVGVFARQMFQKLRDHEPLQTMAYTFFGLLYVVWLFNFISKIVYVVPRGMEGEVQGHFYVLYLIIVTKFSDMGAYLVGSACGKHLLVPHISPKKTWEGFFGALFFSVLGSFGVFWMIPEKLPGLTWVHASILGVLLGFVAVIGDLAESIIKRSTGVKDSGKLLPGIGGALDLIDSLLFTAPLLYFYLQLVIRI